MTSFSGSPDSTPTRNLPQHLCQCFIHDTTLASLANNTQVIDLNVVDPATYSDGRIPIGAPTEKTINSISHTKTTHWIGEGLRFRQNETSLMIVMRPCDRLTAKMLDMTRDGGESRSPRKNQYEIDSDATLRHLLATPEFSTLKETLSKVTHVDHGHIVGEKFVPWDTVPPIEITEEFPESLLDVANSNFNVIEITRLEIKRQQALEEASATDFRSRIKRATRKLTSWYTK